MSPSRYIGRIGALAAALGIGAAVFTPGIAWADTDSADTGGSSSSSAADTGDTAGSESSAAGKPATTRRAPSGRGGKRTPSPSASTAADDSAAPEPDSAAEIPAQADDEPEPTRSRASRTAGTEPADATAPAAGPDNDVVTTPQAPAAAAAVNVQEPQDPNPDSTASPAPAAALASVQSPLPPQPSPAAALKTATSPSQLVSPPPRLAEVISNVVSRISTVFSNTIGQILQSFAGGTPFAPSVNSPAAWLLLAAARRQLPGAAAVGEAAAAPATPVLYLNGYNVVPASTEHVISFYGMYANWPSFPSTVQGTQKFNLVDPDTGETVGSFNALVSNNNSFGIGTKYYELVVTEVVSGTPGAGAGEVPPVGAVISASGDGRYGTVYTAMPASAGGGVSYKFLTPFGDIPLMTDYNAAKDLTDYGHTNRPIVLADGFEIAPTVPSTEEFMSVTGAPPFFTALQGRQTFSVFDSETKEATGSFEGFVTTTSDFFGVWTEAILVTDNDGENVGTGPGQTPPVGSVYNVVYFWSDKTYLLYSSKPMPGGDVVSTQLVTPMGVLPINIPLNASKAPAEDLTVPGGGYTFVPSSEFEPIGVNGLPPREVLVQGYQQFDVYDAEGTEVGSVDAQVARQWDMTGGQNTSILITNVREGTPGTKPGETPPMGSVYTWRPGILGFADFYSALPSPTGNVVTSLLVTPLGLVPQLTLYDAAAGLADYTYANPFAGAPLALQTSCLSGLGEPTECTAV